MAPGRGHLCDIDTFLVHYIPEIWCWTRCSIISQSGKWLCCSLYPQSLVITSLLGISQIPVCYFIARYIPKYGQLPRCTISPNLVSSLLIISLKSSQLLRCWLYPKVWSVISVSALLIFPVWSGFVFVLRFYGPVNPVGVMSSAFSLPNHTFTGQA